MIQLKYVSFSDALLENSLYLVLYSHSIQLKTFASLTGKWFSLLCNFKSLLNLILYSHSSH